MTSQSVSIVIILKTNRNLIMKSYICALLAASTLATDASLSLKTLTATIDSESSACGMSWKTTLTTTTPTVTAARPEGSRDYSTKVTTTQTCTNSAAAVATTAMHYYWCYDTKCNFW